MKNGPKMMILPIPRAASSPSPALTGPLPLPSPGTPSPVLLRRVLPESGRALCWVWDFLTGTGGSPPHSHH